MNENNEMSRHHMEYNVPDIVSLRALQRSLGMERAFDEACPALIELIASLNQAREFLRNIDDACPALMELECALRQARKCLHALDFRLHPYVS